MIASHQQVEVGGAAPYRIDIAPGLLDDGALLASHLRGRHALIVSDSQVAPLYAQRVQAALAAARPDAKLALHVFDAGEASKTLANFSGVIDALAALGATRDACIYALGGGVVGDLAGFAAACWMRGIDVVQLPTTLLAMVDSSVGGKTAVDIAQGKNLVGAFHPPCAVIADTAALRTLPPRELRAGFAEVIKYGAIVDAPFLHWLDANADGLLAGDDALLADAADGERLRALLERFGLPTALPPDLDPAALVARMRLDKKAQGSGLRFVLWNGAGKARVVADVAEARVLDALRG